MKINCVHNFTIIQKAYVLESQSGTRIVQFKISVNQVNCIGRVYFFRILSRGTISGSNLKHFRELKQGPNLTMSPESFGYDWPVISI